ncbi:MAG: hypothetical protein GC159_16925 [Phycisphaera sp.]|nr:hypothetical protein [Phycisphaera sp.]
MNIRRAIGRFGKRLGRIMKHPTMRCIIGLSLALTGLDDLLDALAEADVFIPGIKLAHGVILFGVAQMLTALAEMCEGMAALDEEEAEEEKEIG